MADNADSLPFTSTVAQPNHADATLDPDKLIGRVIEDRYALIKRIGSGAHGDVWEADDRIIGERVAFKWMRVVQRTMLARIRREITTLRLLRFPGVVRLIDDGVADNRPFLVMEFVEGRPFPGTVSTDCTSWQTLETPTLALLETLSHVHAAGVIHRDLKPENVLVRPDGRPVMLDFGISQFDIVGTVPLTDGKQMLGTPLYSAPEQILCGTIDARADLYAIGVMLYEALTGQLPHIGPNPASMMRARLFTPVRPVQDIAPAVPTVVASVVNRLLSTRMEDRYASAADVLAALRGESAPVWVSSDELVTMPLLDETSLAALFAGPDRLFHLREDAARALWQRTDGRPERIEAELLSWTRLGLARRESGLFVVDRDALGRIHAALLPGDETRLHHLLSTELTADAAREAVAVAERYAISGNIGAAAASLGEGLRAAREEHAVALEKQILVMWSKTALADGTPRAIDRVLYELTRVRSRDQEFERLESLLRAAIAAPGAGGIHSLEMADDIGPFLDPELERWRHQIRITAVAARASSGLIAEVLDEIETWAERDDEPLAHLSLAEGRARQRYHEGRFADAAALYARAASLETWTTARVEVMLRSASALLEAFQHEEAAKTALEALAVAKHSRNPYWEGRAEWLLRSARYRTGKTVGPDMELVESVTRLGAQDLEALVCLNEAAVAMRVDMWDVTVTLAERAGTIWRSMGRPFATMIARALAIACGACADADELEALVARAISCKGPGIGIQALGLLGRVYPEKRDSWQGSIAALVRDIPRANWDQRMDVLSVNESLVV